MKKKCIKIIAILLVSLMIFSLLSSVNAAADMEAFIKAEFKGGTNAEGTVQITKILSAILGIVRTVGATVAIVILMIIGAKYVIASAGDRADIKKYAINYIIGAIILFGTSGILSIVKKFVDGSLK